MTYDGSLMTIVAVVWTASVVVAILALLVAFLSLTVSWSNYKREQQRDRRESETDVKVQVSWGDGKNVFRVDVVNEGPKTENLKQLGIDVPDKGTIILLSDMDESIRPRHSFTTNIDTGTWLQDAQSFRAYAALGTRITLRSQEFKLPSS